MVSVDRKLASASLVIIRRLNMENAPAPVQRVIELLELLHLVNVRRDAEQRLRRVDPELTTLWGDINRILLGYEWHPVFPPRSLTAEAVWSKHQAMKTAATGASPFGEIHSSDDITAKEFELQAVWYLVHKGQWENYRHCEQCQQWFYAQTHFQRFCKASCRQEWLSRDEAFKEKRRIYMAKRRKSQKLGQRPRFKTMSKPATRRTK